MIYFGCGHFHIGRACEAQHGMNMTKYLLGHVACPCSVKKITFYQENINPPTTAPPPPKMPVVYVLFMLCNVNMQGSCSRDRWFNFSQKLKFNSLKTVSLHRWPDCQISHRFKWPLGVNSIQFNSVYSYKLYIQMGKHENNREQ